MMQNSRPCISSLRLKNPLVVASCPATEDMERLCRCGEAGASAAILKSCRTIGVELEKGNRRFSASRHGYWGTSARGRELTHPELIGELMSRSRCRTEMILIPSVAGVSLEPAAWVETIKIVEYFQPHCIQLDFFYLKEELSLPESLAKLSSLVMELCSVTKVPLIPKLNVELRPAAAHYALADKGIAGWSVLDSLRCPAPSQIVGNSTYNDELSFASGVSSASLFGGGLLQHTRQYVKELRYRSGLSILAGGGIETPEDIVELLRLGADAVQVASPILREGPEWIRRTLESLSRLPDINDNDYGNGSNDEKTFYAAQALINNKRCKKCRRCVDQMMCNSISMDKYYPTINSRKCEGCGFCKIICPNNAIELIATQDLTLQ